MTALTEYDRLECSALWRAGADEQLQDVIVSIGDATLTISARNETALSHWSLPAIERLNAGELPALFCATDDKSETLEIEDDAMVEALSTIQKAIERRKPHPGRLRYFILGTGAAAVLALSIFWLPGAMISYTASVVPAAKRIAIGQSLLGNIRRVSGQPCETLVAQSALSKMNVRLLGQSGGRIVVVTSGVEQSEHLPGGIILLNKSLVEDYESPEVAAGFVLAEHQKSLNRDPLLRLLDNAGLAETFGLLTSGNISKNALDNYSESILTQAPTSVNQDDMLKLFEDAGVRSTPYAYALDVSGESTLGLIEADPVTADAARPILSDADWVRLQGICGE